MRTLVALLFVVSIGLALSLLLRSSLENRRDPDLVARHGYHYTCVATRIQGGRPKCYWYWSKARGILPAALGS